jgi:hypothetical protein
MTPYFDEPRSNRWLVYFIGSAVFVGILYFCLRSFFGASVSVSAAIAVPVGLLGFVILAKIMEDTDTPPGFWDDSGG